jgi:hypothetical protein
VASYTRAVGYERKVEREIVVGDELKLVTSTVHYPPNVQACMFWLHHRRRRTGATATSIRPAMSSTVSRNRWFVDLIVPWCRKTTSWQPPMR